MATPSPSIPLCHNNRVDRKFFTSVEPVLSLLKAPALGWQRNHNHSCNVVRGHEANQCVDMVIIR
jgi:hypothetical protein